MLFEMKRRFLFALFLLLLTIPEAPGFKVVPRQRYRLEFEARATGNIYPEDLRCQGVKLEYPGVEMNFTDSKGRKYVRLAKGTFFNLHSGDFVPGVIEFYAGEGVKKVALIPRNAEIRNARLVPVNGEKNLAIPLDYRRSGQIRDYTVTPGAPGQAVFDVCNGKIYGDPIPVEGGRRYRLTVIGYAGVSRALRAGLEFYTHDRGGKNSTVRGSRTQIGISGKKQQVIYNFRTPEKTRWMRVTVIRGFVKEYRVEEIQ